MRKEYTANGRRVALESDDSVVAMPGLEASPSSLCRAVGTDLGERRGGNTHELKADSLDCPIRAAVLVFPSTARGPDSCWLARFSRHVAGVPYPRGLVKNAAPSRVVNDDSQRIAVTTRAVRLAVSLICDSGGSPAIAE
jgi:hypothetical protein